MTQPGSARPGRAPFLRIPRTGPAQVLLWNEDCLDGLVHRVAKHSVSCVVTSPPYNRGVAYRTYRDSRNRDEYLAWIGQVGAAVDRALADEGSFFLNLGGSPKDPWIPWDVAQQLRDRFILQNVFHWVKSIVIDRETVGQELRLSQDLALGHYKPVPSSRFVHGAHEYVFQFTRTGHVPIDRLAVGTAYQDKSNVTRWRGARADLRCRGNTWFLPYATIRSRDKQRPHPATFPPELAERCLRLHGLSRIHLVVDPFLGIGSSAVAAVRLGVPFVGFDIDREYLAVARERLASVEAAEVSRIPDPPSRS